MRKAAAFDSACTWRWSPFRKWYPRAPMTARAESSRASRARRGLAIWRFGLFFGYLATLRSESAVVK